MFPQLLGVILSSKLYITVILGPEGSFWNTRNQELHEAPAPLNDASIDPELVFEFDMNGTQN
jgi:hypothetical protein